MNVSQRKEQERYEKKFALYQQLRQITGKEYSVEQGAALLELTIPQIRQVLKLAQQQEASRVR